MPKESHDPNTALSLLNSQVPDIPRNRDEWRHALAVMDRRGNELYDADHDGRITLEDYLDRLWGRALIYHRKGDGRVTLREYVLATLGPPGSSISEERYRLEEEVIKEEFSRFDVAHKGYVTREDFRSEAIGKFRILDPSGRGYYTAAEQLEQINLKRQR